MKWTVKLVAEVGDGKQIEPEIATIEPADGISPATVGLTIAEGKGILESLQKEIVTPQVQQHGVSIASCPRCARAYRTKGYYPSTLRSVHGKVGMRIRRLRGCSCAGSQSCSFSTLFTNKNQITLEFALSHRQDGCARWSGAPSARQLWLRIERHRTPSPINYPAVRLKSGERWCYEPPTGHTVLWTAVASGSVSVPDELQQGELAAFERSSEAVEFVAGTDTEFVLGSAVPHNFDLVLGSHSVHTTPAALHDAQAHLSVIRTRLVQEGRL